jgi:DNA-binding response OmpR family regulator
VVILATGEARYRYLEEELGIDMYLEKPIAVQDLVILVQRWTN